MGFESLSKLLFLFLAIPLVIFYFLKLKRERLKIPSLYLWRQVINDNRVNSPFQKFKKHILLLLQLLLLIFLVLAAGQPYFSGGAGRASLLPIIIDNSASMAAAEAPGKSTRLDRAKDAVRVIVKNKMRNQKIAFISFSKTATRKCDFSDNERVLLDALDQIQVEDVPGRIEDALRMVHAMSRENSFGEVILLSDGNFEEKTNFNLPFKISYRKISDTTKNAGISGLNAKICGENSWIVFAEISRNDPQMPLSVEFYLDGKRASTESIPPGGAESEKISFETSGERSSLIEVRLVGGAQDSLACDNSASLRLPAIRPLWVYVPPTLPAIAASLKGIKGVRLQAAPTEQTDLLVVDSEKYLNGNCRTVLSTGFIPEPLKDVLKNENKSSSIVDWSLHDPLLQHAQLAELIIMGDPTYKSAEPSLLEKPEKLGYETVAFGKNGPLILRKNWGGVIAYNVLFNIEKSTLPYRIAFPVIMTNLVNIARAQAGLADSYSPGTGILPELMLGPDVSCEISAPDGRRILEKTGPTGKLSGIPALKAGRYQISANGELKSEIYASLLNKRETMLAGVDKMVFGELSVSAEKKVLKSPQPLWKILAVLAFLLLLAEWWFFNKAPLGMRRGGANALLLFVLVSFPWNAYPQAAGSAGGMMQFNLVPLSPVLRTGAPVPAELIFNLRGAELLTGKLELEFNDGHNTVLVRHISDELTIIGGAQKKRIMLPVVGAFSNISNVRGTFISNASRIELGSVPLNFANTDARVFCVGYVRAENAIQTESIEMAKHLLPDFFMPSLDKFDAEKKDEGGRFGSLIARDSSVVKGAVAGISSSLFPLGPDACCAYDIIILQEEGFSYLNKKQLDALADWILAGGVACIYPGRAVVQEQHLEFFSRLASCSETKAESPRLDADSHLVFDTKQGAFSRIKAGLGRVAVLKRKFAGDDDFISRDWRQLAGFLLRVRDSRIEQFVDSGKFLDLNSKDNLADLLNTKNYQNQQYSLDSLIFPSSMRQNDDNVQRLFAGIFEPERRFVQGWVIALMLLGVAVLTGPFDYFVLGKLRIRRFTWLFFPVVCICATVFMKMYSDYRIGLDDRLGVIRIIDVGIDNRVLFQEKHEYTFPGKSKIVMKACKNEILCPDEAEGRIDKSYEGTLYSDYRASEEHIQWVPKWRKTLSFSSEDSGKRSWLFPPENSNDGVAKLQESLRASGSDYLVYSLKGGRLSEAGRLVTPGDKHLRRVSEILSSNYNNWMAYGKTSLPNFPVITRNSPLCPSFGIRPIFAIDNSSPNESLLIVILSEGDMIKIYRRGYGI